MNLCRAFLQGGYADLREMHAWNTDFVRTSPVGAAYEQMAREIDRALDFMTAIGAESEELHRVDFAQQPRGVDPRGRARADPDRLPHGQPLQRGPALPLGRGADPAARRRPCGAAVQGEQPDRGQARTHHDPGRRDRSGRQAQPDQPAGSAHVHHLDGLHPGSATCCRTSSRRSPPPVTRSPG